MQHPRSTSSPNVQLVRESARPLYEQLTEQIRQLLLEQYRPGDKIPTEEMLGETYSTSRITVRRALQQLVDEGVLVRRQGKGTFIARPLPRIVHPIDRLAPFVATFREYGETPTTEMLQMRWLELDQVPAAIRTPGARALLFRRLYLSSGNPHVLASVTLPDHLAERFTRAQLEGEPIYDALKNVLGIQVTRADFTVSSVLAAGEIATALEVSEGTPLLLLERLSYCGTQLVELGALHMLPEVYKLSVSVTVDARTRGEPV